MLSEFAKEKVFWTKKMNLRLVKFIKRRPNIWNPKHPRYTSVDFRDRTYAEFASKCGDKFTGQAVKDRWTNIRSTFRSYLKKYNDICARGESEDYKVSWYLWHPCQFLIEDKTVSAVYTSAAEDESENSDSQEIDKEFKQELSDAANEISETFASNLSADCKEIASNLFKVFQGVQNDSFGIENPRYGRIGRIVADRLSQMTPLDAASTSTKIMEILCLYEESNPNNPSNYKQHN